jgi:hypothetical protein
MIAIIVTLAVGLLLMLFCYFMEARSHADTRCRLYLTEKDLSVTAGERDTAYRMADDLRSLVGATHHRCARCGRYITKGQAVFRNTSGHKNPQPFHRDCVLPFTLKPTSGA